MIISLPSALLLMQTKIRVVQKFIVAKDDIRVQADIANVCAAVTVFLKQVFLFLYIAVNIECMCRINKNNLVNWFL